jgi:hypothetical protein
MDGDYTDFCGFCGIALTVLEVSADLECNLIDYTEHNKGIVQISLCEDCKLKMMEIQFGGMSPALIKRAELDRLHNEEKNPPKYIMNAKKWKGRDDEDGGVKTVHPP